jgi:hypothetical protein
MQEDIGAAGVAGDSRLLVPKMRLQILPNDLQLILETKRSKFTTRLTTRDIEPPVS